LGGICPGIFFVVLGFFDVVIKTTTIVEIKSSLVPDTAIMYSEINEEVN